MIPDLSHWERLAPVWALFEHGGLQPSQLQALMPRIRGAALVVGAGRGLLTSALNSAGAEHVVGVDFSPAMIRSGVELSRTVAATGDALPFRDCAFDCVIVATGVLDPADPKSVTRIRQEVIRVVRPGGTVLFAFFRPATLVSGGLQRLGLMTDATQHTDRIVELCFAIRNKTDADPGALVAAWAGCDPQEAFFRVRQEIDLLIPWFNLLDKTLRHLRECGDPAAEATLLRACAWSISGWAEAHVPPVLLDDPRLRLIRDTTYDDSCIRVLVMSRHNSG
jgi:SAM-dependent methyltransferase